MERRSQVKYENNADLVGAITILERGHRLLACGDAVQSGRSVKQEPTKVSQLAFSRTPQESASFKRGRMSRPVEIKEDGDLVALVVFVALYAHVPDLLRQGVHVDRNKP